MGGMWKVCRKQFAVSDSTETRQQQIKWVGMGFGQTKVWIWWINSEEEVTPIPVADAVQLGSQWD